MQKSRPSSADISSGSQAEPLESSVDDSGRAVQIQRIERFSEWLDSAFEIPVIGYRVGWDTVIGLVPGIGDLATTFMSGWIINEARKLGVSRWTLLRMLANSGFDFAVGIVPVAGDVLDATFRSNQRNLALLKIEIERQQQRSKS